MLVLRTFIQLLGHESAFLGRVVSENIVWLHLWQVELLRAKDRSRSSDPNPPDKALCWNLEMLHSPEANESSGSSESSLTVNSNSSVIRFFKVSLDDIEEIPNDMIRRCGSVNKEQLCVINSVVDKMIFVILLLVESNDSRNIRIFEDFNIFIWMLAVSVLSISDFNRTHECGKLSWDDPVHISVLNPLVIFVFLDIERPEIIPSESYSVLKTLKAVQKCAIIEAVSFRCISVVSEHLLVWLELIVSLLSGHLQDNDHEGSHQESSIHHSIPWVSRGAVMENSILGVILIS